MAAPMATSPETSSSEDEEENAKFKEAVFEIPIGKLVQVKTDFHQTNDKERIPSKRPDKDISDADQFDNAYNTTPGFRKHVSKKLSEALDSVIDTSCEYFGKSVDNAEEDSGVKLFSSSKLVLQLDSSQVESGKPVNKRRLPSSSDSSSEDERLAEASVSHDFVLQQSNLPYLTNQKAADIIINQADPPGVANKNNNPTDNSSIHTNIKDDSAKEKINNDHIDKNEEISECSIKKHKKKKKKKHKKGVD